jgi:ribosomal protein S12 methylthiotransferase accessory factor
MTPGFQTSTLDSLFQPAGGLFNGYTRLRAASDEPALHIRIERMGDVGQVWSNVGRAWRAANVRGRESVEGAGVGLTDAEATVRSRGEALERYSACVFTPDQFIRASAAELGSQALDLNAVPRCSKKELANPRCPLLAPDMHAPIRWVRGVSLLDGRLLYVPAVMVYLYPGFEGPGERIWFPISTGCAAHVSLERALLSAIQEVVERDSISITWLQQLRLPRIELDAMPQALAAIWERYQRASSSLEYVFFDATTDMGIPTVYGLQISHHHRRLTTLVSCCTALDPADAVIGSAREMAAGRIAFQKDRPAPVNFEEFTEIFHGASYMARAEQAGAFDFLLHSGSTTRLSEMAAIAPGDERQRLQAVLERFRRKQLEVVAVDLSTDEALRAGMRVVRVVIPGLQPVSFHYCARYLGHPRLYQAPSSMGHPVHQENDLNQWPQPFA